MGAANVALTGETGRARLPQWLGDHFEEALDSHEKLMRIARLSAQGITMHLARPNAIKVLAETGGVANGEKNYAEQLQRAESDAALARTEIDEDFPVLNAFITIALWSWLEDFVKGLVCEWLLHRRSSLRAPAIQKLKIKFGDYLLLSKQEQVLQLVELLEQDTGASLKQGATRFSSLLEVIGLSFQITEEDRRTLFEFQAVRNNLAHRSARADNRLRSACPWLKLKNGQPVRVSQSMIMSYSEVGASILLGLLYKVGGIYGINLRAAGEHVADPGLRSG